MSLISRLLGQPEMGVITYPSHSPEDLAARWLQWAASIHCDDSPIADETGEDADRLQPEDVWFLAGCFGGTVVRRCTVPVNRKLFFPIINTWFEAGEEPHDHSNIFGLLKVNGKTIELDKIYTQKPALIKGIWGNPVTGSIFGTRIFVGGLWKLLEPLPVGEHEIYFRARCDDFELTVTYLLTVK